VHNSTAVPLGAATATVAPCRRDSATMALSLAAMEVATVAALHVPPMVAAHNYGRCTVLMRQRC
jgi:hypothetical protein